jgi:hypothetical protein
MNRSVIALVTLLLMNSGSSALPASGCRSTVDGKLYLDRGGKLVHLNREPHFKIPENFFCDRVACFGEVEFSFLINQAGGVTGVSVIKNTWTASPEYHASVITPHVMKMRYAPPRLNNKPVCVLAKFSYTMKGAAEK